VAETRKLAGWPPGWILSTGCDTIFGAACLGVRYWLKNAHIPVVES
jgi:hypothetical protein